MYVVGQLLSLILLMLLIILSILKISGIIGDFENIKITYPSVVSLISNIIAVIIFLYSIIISNNNINLPSRDFMNNLFYSYIFLLYITFIINLIFIWYRGNFGINKTYILINSIFLSIMIPLIVFRNDLYFEEYNLNDFDEELINKSIEEGGLLDLIGSDNKGNKMQITDEEEIEIRKNAARSEFNERMGLNDGIYD